MDIVSGVVTPLITALVGGAATYGALSARLARAEKDIEAITVKNEEMREKLGLSRESQGERIGAVEDRVAKVDGACQAILTILDGSLVAQARRKPPSTSG